MEVVACKEDVNQLAENRISGIVPELHNTKIIFKGSGNIIHFEPNTILSNSKIVFNGSNSVAAMGGGATHFTLI